MDFRSAITLIVSTLTLISNIVYVLVLVLIFAHKEFRNWLFAFVNKYIIELLFLLSSIATLGSLTYSNIVGFPPCELCWIQRIFMFPQPILALVALGKRDKNLVNYLFPLSIIGGVVALYHSLANLGIGSGLLGCTAVGGECARLYVLKYGYITIPFMSLTIFVYLITLSIIYYKSRKNI